MPRRPKTGKYRNLIPKEAVPIIRRQVANYEVSQSELARRYGVSHTAISNIVLRKTYRDVA